MAPEFALLPITLDDIIIGEARRLPQQDKLDELTDSIERVGLLNAISVHWVAGKPILIAGLHRLLALKRLGLEATIAQVYSNLSETDAELIEIDENLARAELTELERSEQVARRIKLTMERQAAEPAEQPKEQQREVSRQLDAKPSGGRPEGGVRAAAREAGVPEADARRAIKVSSLTPEAKTAARAYGLDKNQSALLAATKQSEPEKQVAVLRELFDAKQTKAERKAKRAERREAFERFIAAADRQRKAKSDPVVESDDESAADTDEDGYYLKNEPADQWRRSVIDVASNQISMPAFWAREFGKHDFTATSEMVQLALDAALMWSNLAVDLKKRIAVENQQQAA